MTYLAAMHDVGKCHRDFQAKGSEAVLRPLEEAGLRCPRLVEGFRHEAFGAEWLLDSLTKEHGWEINTARTASEAVHGHHGDFNSDNPPIETVEQKAIWDPLRRELDMNVRAVFSPGKWEAQFSDHSVVGILLAGIIVFSDWVASNLELFPQTWEGESLAEYAIRSRKRAEAAIARMGLTEAVSWATKPDFRDVWVGESFQNPRPIQVRCEELCKKGLDPGLAIIEAPMGEGKTEAAIYLATRWLSSAELGGVFVALPTAATSNQMYGRVKSLLNGHCPRGAEGVRLVHGMAWMLDEATPETGPRLADQPAHEREKALDWFRPKKRSLLAPYGVGTVDQVLMSVLHVRHGFLRLFGLAGKVLIVDEVHAYDAYMARILSLLLKWCRSLRIPVILLSATLPAARRTQLLHAYTGGFNTSDPKESTNAYPLISFADLCGTVREEPVAGSSRALRVNLRNHSGTIEEEEATARLVVERLRMGGCLCVIANTVDSAQRIYYQLKRLISARVDLRDTQHLLFHSRFEAGRRQEIENQALAWFDKRSLLSADDPRRTPRPKRAVLIATQVVEQSLDLDFDEMFTQISPMDLLLQRVGRLHRHDRPNRPTGSEACLNLLMPSGDGVPDFGPTEKVYERYVLLKTIQIIGGKTCLSLPADIRPLVDMVYDESTAADSWEEQRDLETSLDKMKRHIEEEQNQALSYLVPEPCSHRFKLADDPRGGFDEEDSDASSYFTARTRLGDENRKMLILDGEDNYIIPECSKAPSQASLRELMLKTVSVPRWWFSGDLQAEEGYRIPEPAPRWLPGTSILHLKSGCWRGQLKGKGVMVRNDREFGLMREEEGGDQ